MIAKLAYLTTPAPDRYILNIQPFGSDNVLRFEIGKAHLANIIIDGTSLALRSAFVHHRVPLNNSKEECDDRSIDRSQQLA